MAEIGGWAIAWYRKEDWSKWHAVCPDFAPDYDQWLSRATTGFEQARQAGHSPQKVTLDPDKFIEWSKHNGGKIDGKARSAYAVWVMTHPTH
jgi:hypothetical protein